MSDIKFNCPNCDQAIEAPQDMLGKTIDCPACQKSVRIPGAQHSNFAWTQTPETSSTSQKQESTNKITTFDDRQNNKALAHLSSILVANEKVDAYAMQRYIFALTHRRNFVFATSGRFIGMTRGLFGGFTPQDVRWQDVKDIRISVGIFAADLTIEALSSPDITIDGKTRTLRFTGLRKDAAQSVYRICQANEQAWREKRRLRELEELRAKSGGIQFGSPTGSPPFQQPATEGGDAVRRLQQAKDMLAQGLINDTEYETIKARIVSSI
jgi:hypothetical protein